MESTLDKALYWIIYAVFMYWLGMFSEALYGLL